MTRSLDALSPKRALALKALVANNTDNSVVRDPVRVIMNHLEVSNRGHARRYLVELERLGWCELVRDLDQQGQPIIAAILHQRP